MKRAAVSHIDHELARAVAQAEHDLSSLPSGELKRMRKAIRRLVLADLQRRAITGEPRLLERAE